jgi:hypothetical protein
VSDPLHPADRAWVAYHVKMGLTSSTALELLAKYRMALHEASVSHGSPDISDVAAAAEAELTALRARVAELEAAAMRTVGQMADDMREREDLRRHLALAQAALNASAERERGLREDAERYRWLRKGGSNDFGADYYKAFEKYGYGGKQLRFEADLDRAIDKARGGE